MMSEEEENKTKGNRIMTISNKYIERIKKK